MGSPPARSDRRADLLVSAWRRWHRVLLRRVGFARAGLAAGWVGPEDVLQEAAARCLSAESPLASADEMGAYLRRVALNQVADAYREERAGRTLSVVPLESTAQSASRPEAFDVSDASHDPLDRVQHRQRLARLAQAMDELPARQREALVLHRFDGLTQDEVAGRMGISRRMVVKHLSRAMAYCELRVQYASAGQMQRLAPGGEAGSRRADGGEPLDTAPDTPR